MDKTEHTTSVEEAKDGQGNELANKEEDEDEEFDKWCGFMKTMLGCLSNKEVEVEACSISLVPKRLRESKEDANYTPQVVSIGPLHKGTSTTSTDLLYMEEIKWRCMEHLLHRADEGPVKALEKCGKAMLNLDEIVRASYNVDEVKFNRNKLAQIMVLDGCFLLELLITSSPELNHKLKCSLRDDPGAEVVKREKVLSDLTMLENQIPLFVLDTLFANLFSKFFEKDVITIRLIHENALSIFGYSSPDFHSYYSTEFKAFHFLQLVHLFIHKENHKATDEWKLPIDGEEETESNISHRKVKLARCATRLQAAGVTIGFPKSQSDEASNRKANNTRFDFKVTFSESNGKLEIPQLHITETTEAKWRNFIAWELNRSTLEKQRDRKKDRISCQFISYAWFFQNLICSVHDVKLLLDKNVIVVHDKSMSNENLMNLLRNITQGVSDADGIHMNPRFTLVMNKLKNYPTVERSTGIIRIIINRVTVNSKIRWHVFRCFLTWIWYKWIEAYGVLRSVYIPSGWGLIAMLAAAAGLALTAVQTHYSIHS